MKSIDELAAMLDERLQQPHLKDRPIDRQYAISETISWWMDDVLKMVKNINETSLPGEDRTKRIYDLEKKFGIPKRHLL